MAPRISLVTKIDSDIPPPPGRGHMVTKYSFDQLQVGDSAFYQITGYDIDRMRATLAQFARRNERQFTTRRVIENGVSGARVWRLA